MNASVIKGREPNGDTTSTLSRGDAPRVFETTAGIRQEHSHLLQRSKIRQKFLRPPDVHQQGPGRRKTEQNGKTKRHNNRTDKWASVQILLDGEG